VAPTPQTGEPATDRARPISRTLLLPCTSPRPTGHRRCPRAGEQDGGDRPGALASEESGKPGSGGTSGMIRACCGETTIPAKTIPTTTGEADGAAALASAARAKGVERTSGDGCAAGVKFKSID